MGYIGWTIMVVGLCALLALALTSGDIRDRLAGTGDRRISRRARLKELREENRAQRKQIEACPHCTPPVFSTPEAIAYADATDNAPTFHLDAPADGADWQPAPAPSPAEGGHLLTELVEPDPEATQSLGVSALRAAAQMDAGDTITLPAVSDVKPPLRLDPVPPVTWRPKPLWEGRARDAESAAIEATLGIPGPDPLHSATAVPAGIPEKARINVATALEEAS